MRWLRWAGTILKLLSVGLLGCCVSVAALLFIHSIPKSDAFFVRGAMLEGRVQPATLPFDDVPVFGHRLAAGSKLVLGYRWFHEPSLIVFDDEEYEKLSVELPTSPGPDVRFSFGPNGDAIAFYSRGGSAWPRAGCHGYFASGSVEVHDDGERIRATIVGQVEPLDGARGCDEHDRSFSLIFRSLPLADVTPWLGKRGGHAYDETYRREFW